MVTVWYMTCAEDEEQLAMSVRIMHAYDWVKTIVIMHTDTAPNFTLHQQYPKVREMWEPGLRLANGQLDEVTARNVCLDFAEKQGNEWLLQCDSDECYLDHTVEMLKQADCDGVWMGTYNVCSLTEYLALPVNPAAPMQDAHMRAWKSSLKLRYARNAAYQHNINPTVHCELEKGNINQGMTNPDTVYHIHFKHLIYSTIGSGFAAIPKATLPAVLPFPLIDYVTAPGYHLKPFRDRWKLEFRDPLGPK